MVEDETSRSEEEHVQLWPHYVCRRDCPHHHSERTEGSAPIEDIDGFCSDPVVVSSGLAYICRRYPE